MYAEVMAQLKQVTSMGELRYLEETETDEGALELIHTWFTAEELEQLQSVNNAELAVWEDHVRNSYTSPFWEE